MMEQYEMFELSFEGEVPAKSHTVIDLEAIFKTENMEKKVKGFYAGNGIYKVRFLPQIAGEYQREIHGCVEASGKTVCEAAPEEGRQHGIVHAKATYFVHDDGTEFLPFGTTIYALAHQRKELLIQTYETLKNAPFNKIRHSVFPKYYDYNRDEPEFFAFEKDANGNWDMDHPNFVFWDHLEEIIFRLAEMGIQSDLILFHPYDMGHWGLDQITMEQIFLYLDYLLRRLSAIPDIWWSMANEFDIIFSRTEQD